MVWGTSDRIELSKIPALTLYKNAEAVGRRTRLPQLVCKGKPCNLYQPEVVHCTKLPGGSGINIDWKCEADLPEALRFGKVDVSCEGWSGPGDAYVVKGSCSLEYRLVEVPGALRGHSPTSRWSSQDLLGTLFTVIWGLVLFYICYTFIYSFLSSRNQTRSNSQSTSRPRPGGGGDNSTNWRSSGTFPGEYDDPPPPYTDNRKTNPSGEGWRPGFWTGTMLGGLAAHLFNRNPQPAPAPVAPATPYDWERERSGPFLSRPLRRAAPTRPLHQNEDRGEGPSNLGSMRRSTGYGNTNVR